LKDELEVYIISGWRHEFSAKNKYVVVTHSNVTIKEIGSTIYDHKTLQ